VLIIRVLLAVVALVLYGAAGKVILKLFNMPTTLRAMAIYVFSGPSVGFLVLIVQVALLAEEQGHIGHEQQILGVITISLVVALVVSVVSVKLFGSER